MDNQFDILDILNILSFYIGLKNLDENLSQGKASDMLEIAVEDIHKHLKQLDEKLARLEELINENNQKISEQNR